MINFTDKEIEYIKNEVKGAYNMMHGSEEEKEIMKHMDAEEKVLIESFVKDKSLFDRANIDDNINKSVEDLCWGSPLNFKIWWLRGYDKEDVLNVLADCGEDYVDLYERLVNLDVE